MFKLEIKEEPCDNHDHVKVKEEMLEKNFIKVEKEFNEVSKEIQKESGNNQVCLKEEFSDDFKVKIKKEPSDVVETDLQEQNFNFETDASLKVESALDDAVEKETVLHEKNSTDEGIKPVTLEISDLLEVNIETVGEHIIEEQKKNGHIIKKRPADWLSQSSLYCPKCKATIKKQRRDRMKYCPNCKIDYLFQCSLCKKNYKQSKRLSHHLKYYCTKEKQLFSCVECNYITNDPSILKDHIKYVHCENQKINCSVCEKMFKSRRCLQSHVRYSHEKPVLKCDHCFYTTKSKKTLVKHLNRHLKISKNKDCMIFVDEKVTCQVCFKILKNKKTLTAHMKYSHEKSLLECEYCLFVTKFKSYMSKHMHTFHPHINTTETLSNFKIDGEGNIIGTNKENLQTYVIGKKIKSLDENEDQKEVQMVCVHCKYEVCSISSLVTHVINKHFDEIKLFNPIK